MKFLMLIGSAVALLPAATVLAQAPNFEAQSIPDAFAIFDASHYLHRFHHDHMRFARGRDEIAGAQALLDRFDELWDASTPAAAINVLGL